MTNFVKSFGSGSGDYSKESGEIVDNTSREGLLDFLNGDYTKERQAVLEENSIDDIVARIKERKA